MRVFVRLCKVKSMTFLAIYIYTYVCRLLGEVETVGTTPLKNGFERVWAVLEGFNDSGGLDGSNTKRTRARL